MVASVMASRTIGMLVWLLAGDRSDKEKIAQMTMWSVRLHLQHVINPRRHNCTKRQKSPSTKPDRPGVLLTLLPTLKELGIASLMCTLLLHDAGVRQNHNTGLSQIFLLRRLLNDCDDDAGNSADGNELNNTSEPMGVCCPSCRELFRRYSSDVANMPPRHQQQQPPMLGMLANPESDCSEPNWVSGAGIGEAFDTTARRSMVPTRSFSAAMPMHSYSPPGFVPGRSAAAPHQQAGLLPWNEMMPPQGQVTQAAGFAPPPQSDCFLPPPQHQQRLVESSQQLSAMPRLLPQLPPAGSAAPLLQSAEPQQPLTTVGQLVIPAPRLFASASQPFVPPSTPAAAATIAFAAPLVLRSDLPLPPPLAPLRSSPRAAATLDDRHAAEIAVPGSAFSAFRPLPQAQATFPAAAARLALQHQAASALSQLGTAGDSVAGGGGSSSSNHVASTLTHTGGQNWAPIGSSAVAAKQQQQPPRQPPLHRRPTMATPQRQHRREREQFGRLLVEHEHQLQLRDQLVYELMQELHDLMQYNFPSWLQQHQGFGAPGGRHHGYRPSAAAASAAAAAGDLHVRESHGPQAPAVASVLSASVCNSGYGQQPENSTGNVARAAACAFSCCEADGDRRAVAVGLSPAAASSCGVSVPPAAAAAAAEDCPEPHLPSPMVDVDDELSELFGCAQGGASN